MNDLSIPEQLEQDFAPEVENQREELNQRVKLSKGEIQSFLKKIELEKSRLEKELQAKRTKESRKCEINTRLRSLESTHSHALKLKQDISHAQSEIKKLSISKILEEFKDTISEAIEVLKTPESSLLEKYEQLKTIVRTYIHNLTRSFNDRFYGILNQIETIKEHSIPNQDSPEIPALEDIKEKIEQVELYKEEFDDIQKDLQACLQDVESSFQYLYDHLKSLVAIRSEFTPHTLYKKFSPMESDQAGIDFLVRSKDHILQLNKRINKEHGKYYNTFEKLGKKLAELHNATFNGDYSFEQIHAIVKNELLPQVMETEYKINRGMILLHNTCEDTYQDIRMLKFTMQTETKIATDTFGSTPEELKIFLRNIESIATWKKNEKGDDDGNKIHTPSK